MARITIAQLQAQLAAARTEIARQGAEYQALAAAHDARCEELRSAQRRIEELGAECMRLQQHGSDALTIRNRADLLATVRALSAQGVPCFTRGGHIYHARTRAILASMQ